MAACETIGGDLADWLSAHGVGTAPSSQADIDIRYGDVNKAAVPAIKINMSCIVSVIIFNDRGQVLMIQESKKECYGKWYLPAGRLERGETILDAARREVKEESGFECQPTALLCAESQGAAWYRFTLSGSVSGGRLKTLADGDRESLQAAWCHPDDVLGGTLPLRCRDVIPLLKLALESADRASRQPALLPPTVLPVAVPHSRLLVRALLIFKKRAAGDAAVLLSRPRGRLPVVEFAVGGHDIPTALDVLTEILPDAAKRFATVGKRTVASVEFCSTSSGQSPGRGATDGLCLTVAETLLYDGDLPAVVKGYSFAPLSPAQSGPVGDLSAIAELLPPLMAL